MPSNPLVRDLGINSSMHSAETPAKRGLVQAFFYNDPDTYPPIVNAMRILAQDGFEIELLGRETGTKWGVAYPNAACVVRVDSRSKGSWREFFGYLRHCIGAVRPEAGFFWGHDMHGLMAARFLGWRYRRPVVYQCHEYLSRTERIPLGSRMVRIFEQQFARTAAFVVAPDQDRAMAMQRDLFLPRAPIVAANAPRWTSRCTSSRLGTALHQAGKSWEKIVFRQGRIGPGHAIENTVRSIPKWQNQKWGFAVMGVVSESFRTQVVALARSLGVESQFHILPPVGYDQVAEFTVGADVGHGLYEPINFTNQHYTTSSNKIMEYMAAGLPLLVSDTERLRELVGKWRCGMTANEGIPAEIANAVNHLLADNKETRRAGEAGRRAFEEQFCFERQFAPVLDRMRALTTSPPPAS